MSLEDVQLALITKFNAGMASWATKIAWPNVAFTPAAASDWMAWHFMPGEEVIATLSTNGFDTNNGLIQIDLNTPIGKGEGTTRQTIGELRSCFKPQVLLYGAQLVTILGRYSSNGREIDGFHRIPFTIRWRAQIPRNA